MTTAEAVYWMVILSGTLRVMCLFAAALAIHDVIRNGLHIRSVPVRVRPVLYFALAGFSASAMASIFRLAGESWAPLFRELSHCGVSLGIIAVSVLIVNARSCAGAWMDCSTGEYQHATATGPGRERTETNY